MDSSIKTVIDQFKLHQGLLDGIFKEIKDEDFLVRPGGTANSLQWLFGHITATRFGIAKHFGVDEAVPWADDLFKGGQELKPTEAYPSVPEIKHAWDRISGKLIERLESLTSEELQRETEDAYPMMEKTPRGMLTFLAFHEAGHVGQMMYARKLLGYDRAFF